MNTKTAKTQTPDISELARSYMELAGALDRKPTMQELADKHAISMAELRREVSGEFDLLNAFSKWVDMELSARASVDMDMPKRERVLDLLMERFDISAPYKKGIGVIFGYVKKDIALAAKLNCASKRSMGWVLTLSGQNPRGFLRDGLRQGLVFAMLAATETWLKDETPDSSKTLAKLDQELRKGEKRLETISSLMKCLPKRSERSKARKAAAVA